jgi:hypothetical protein
MYRVSNKADGLSSVEIVIPTNVQIALKQGLVLLDAHFGPKGVEVWVRNTNPDKTHKSMSLEEADEVYTSFTPAIDKLSVKLEGTNKEGDGIVESPGVPVSVAKPVSTPDPDLEKIRDLDVARSYEIVKSARLNFHRQEGILTEYAHNSLVKADFKRANYLYFAARVMYIADNIGPSAAVSRLFTNDTLRINGTNSLHSWWDKADSLSKAKLLTTKKKCDPEQITIGDLSKLDKMKCPFSDARFGTDNQSSGSDC